MPVYLYRCSHEHLFESLHGVDAMPPACPDCGDPVVARQVAGFAIFGCEGGKNEADDFRRQNHVWLQSDGHRRMRQQNERIYDRTTGAQDSLRSHLQKNEWRGTALKERWGEISKATPDAAKRMVSDLVGA